MEKKNANMVLYKKGEILMPFKDGTYKHECGFIITIVYGTVMISPNHPLSLRLSELFDTTKWKEV